MAIARKLDTEELYDKLETQEGGKRIYRIDRVPREILYWCLRRKGVSEKIVRMAMETNQDCKTAVRTIEGLSREFEIGVGLHKGSALSPLLIAVIIDVLSEHLRAENLWELLFADDLAIMVDSEEKLQERETIEVARVPGEVWVKDEC